MGRHSVLCNHIRNYHRSSVRISHLCALSQNPKFFSSSASSGHYNLCPGFTPPIGRTHRVFSNTFAFRFHCSHSSAGDQDSVDHNNNNVAEKHSGDSSELVDLGLDGLEAVGGADGSGGWFSPVRAVIALLDGAHDLTGLPWWAIIVTSTLSLRMAILPILVFQLRKLAKMSELMSKLPPPFPPPFSGKSLRKQFLLFQKERRAIGCPSPLWGFASFFVQVPCFILWMTSIRRMSLDAHPGFDTGGILWFQNLTEFPHGVLGLIFPTGIAVLHFTNVRLSFKTSAIETFPGVLGLLAKYYRWYLNCLTLPIFLIGFHVPQGSLVYWLTNSSLNLVQQLSFKNHHFRRMLKLDPPSKSKTPAGKFPTGPILHPLSLKHPYILQKLGLPATNAPVEHEKETENLLPDDLLDLAIQKLATGDHDGAFPLLRLAAEKDPELARSSIAMGMLLFSRGLLTEAADYFVHAISKIRDDDDLTLFFIANFGAGVSLASQPGRESEGIEHLKRIAVLKEPENPMDKHCYFQGLVVLGSTLFNQGQKAEAAKYLRIAAAYDPSVNAYVKECERDEESV